ncbi:MAG: MIP/aquaporin family protein, partial [Planctomycetaceae bacterium]
LFGPLLDEREKQLGVARGGPGSELTAMCYGEYYPNPGLMHRLAGRYDPGLAARHYRLVSTPVAFLAEFLGTALLGAVILAVTAPGRDDPPAKLAPVLIGLTVTALIAVLAPLTQACFNPARDLGPRLFAAVAGWGPQALPGPRGWEMLWVYGVAPVLGAWCGMQFYLRWFEPAAGPTQPPS